MLTLTYGLKQMEDNDPSEDWFVAIDDNFIQLDAHDHDGINSAPLNSVVAVALTTQAVLAAAWGATIGNGRYRQLVTLPTVTGIQIQYDKINIAFRLTSTMEQVYASIEKVSATTYYVYTVDNTKDYTAIYST